MIELFLDNKTDFVYGMKPKSSVVLSFGLREKEELHERKDVEFGVRYRGDATVF